MSVISKSGKSQCFKSFVLKIIILQIQKKNIPWTEAEKEFFKLYVHEMPRGVKETMTEYWQKCSVAMNTKYPRGMRNGIYLQMLRIISQVLKSKKMIAIVLHIF
jgi:hypothetical protein